MKFQIGDKVLILHSNEEGEVIDIINDKMVMVDVKGVKFPAYIDQLDFPYFKRFSAPRVADGVWISFLPVTDFDEFGDEVVEELKIHLVNRTEASYDFTYR